MQNEEEIISGCIKGERKSQELLYQLFSKKMLVVSMRYSKGIQEAEDILQESFIKIFDHIKSFKRESSLYYWIKRIVINTALNYQRSKLYLYPMVDVTNLKNDSKFDYDLSHMELDELLKMVQSLPTGCQVVFNLYAIEGYRHQEISQMLRISVGTSKSQYARAKALLQQRLLKSENRNYEEFR